MSHWTIFNISADCVWATSQAIPLQNVHAAIALLFRLQETETVKLVPKSLHLQVLHHAQELLCLKTALVSSLGPQPLHLHGQQNSCGTYTATLTDRAGAAKQYTCRCGIEHEMPGIRCVRETNASRRVTPATTDVLQLLQCSTV